MKDLKFIHSWEKTRRRGSILYVLVCTVLTVTASYVGKCIGDYISNGTILISFPIQDIFGLIFVSLISLLIGVHLWHHNETRYKELMKKDNKSN